MVRSVAGPRMHPESAADIIARFFESKYKYPAKSFKSSQAEADVDMNSENLRESLAPS